jgi:hypothetical protein
MANKLIKQPNGKYAIFSTIVDNFTAYDMTEEEYIEYSLEIINKEYQQKIINIRHEAMRKIAFLNNRSNTLIEYNKCIETIKLLHGQQEVDKILISYD